MTNAKCCEKCPGRWILVLVVVLASLSGDSQASPFDPSFFPEGVQSVVVNPFNRTILNRFNLTEEQILSIQNRSNPNMRNDTSTVTNQQHLQRATERLNDIIKRVHKAISNEALPKEKAGFPICTGETTSPAEWQNASNLTLYFAQSVFTPSNDYDRLNSALLRLYKTNPGQNREQFSGQGLVQPVSTEQPASPTPLCAEPVGPQIRVTVSIVHQQKKKLRKKRTCNTVMMSSTSTGWVEIDVKCALAYWEQQNRQDEHRQDQVRQPHPRQQQNAVIGMLVIEVHDDEENPLRPGLYFAPPTCDQAAAAIPWNTYGTESLSTYLAGRTVPRKPRLDLKFNGSNSLKRLCNSPKLPSSRAPITGIESTTSNSLTIDNQLLDETSETDRSHHEVKVEDDIEAEAAAEADLMSSASNSEQEMEPISNHHRRRTGHHHRHHHHPHELQQHHHHQRHHHKHHIIPHQQE
ncbi:hypothetical protein KR059_011993 [Drosophila kikkawai]|nr:hypothetical protein KR059_011993 [Drosophila kikkawai]